MLDQGGCPWKDHIFEIEQELGLEKSIKFVLYSDQSGKWRIQCVNIRPGSFHSRVPLPENWRGLRDADLAKESGFDDAIFIHATGFIGGCHSKESVIGMARYTLEQV